MPDFTTTLLALIVAAHGPRAEGHPENHIARLTTVSNEFMQAATDHPLFTGEAAVPATAMALYAVAYHESGFWSKAQDCSACYIGSPWCDGGRSVTMFQLQGSVSWGRFNRSELCSSNANATERALRILWKNKGRCSITALFQGYAHARTPTDEMESIYRKGIAKAGLRVVCRDNRLQAFFAPLPSS